MFDSDRINPIPVSDKSTVRGEQEAREYEKHEASCHGNGFGVDGLHFRFCFGNETTAVVDDERFPLDRNVPIGCCSSVPSRRRKVAERPPLSNSRADRGVLRNSSDHCQSTIWSQTISRNSWHKMPSLHSPPRTATGSWRRGISQVHLSYSPSGSQLP